MKKTKKYTHIPWLNARDRLQIQAFRAVYRRLRLRDTTVEKGQPRWVDFVTAICMTSDDRFAEADEDLIQKWLDEFDVGGKRRSAKEKKRMITSMCPQCGLEAKLISPESICGDCLEMNLDSQGAKERNDEPDNHPNTSIGVSGDIPDRPADVHQD